MNLAELLPNCGSERPCMRFEIETVSRGTVAVATDDTNDVNISVKESENNRAFEQ